MILLVNCPHGFYAVRLLDHEGYVHFRPLREHHHVDTGNAESVEYPPEGSVGACHAGTDNGDDRNVTVEVELADESFLFHLGKSGECCIQLFFRDDHGDGHLGSRSRLLLQAS